ncbi:hypothetical protein NDU88_007373 [Pleurodeles waltl]|uniref:MHC class I antigen n=1 Tax=Pleurodeles waltl TaxID=8319 RepID=A0AAV7PP31_PLEWA|nr:hypothetical protein NDU88_007373 [Pleurodeles waltl]
MFRQTGFSRNRRTGRYIDDVEARLGQREAGIPSESCRVQTGLRGLGSIVPASGRLSDASRVTCHAESALGRLGN